MYHADGVPRIVGRYRLTGKQLGRGNYATVEEALQLDLETLVAIKLIDTGSVRDPYVLRNLHREASVLRHLNHPHVVAIFESMRAGPHYCIVTELVAGGELSSFVQRQPRGHLDERTTLQFAAQLVAALAHMHERGIVHRDLKMKNILLNKGHSAVKIVDFGLSNFWTPDKPLKTHCGSPGYAAPEIYVYGRTYGPEVDLWSLGVVFYAMAVGRLPFPTCKEKNTTARERRKRLLEQIVRGATEAHIKAMSHFSPPFRDLVQGLLTAPAARRLTLPQVLEHPWLVSRLRVRQINAQPYRLHAREQALILTKLSVMLNMSVAAIEAHCQGDKLGEVAAMYNILAHKQLSSYHASWGLRRTPVKEKDQTGKQKHTTSHTQSYPCSAQSVSQTQRYSVHTLPPRVPAGRMSTVTRPGTSGSLKLGHSTPDENLDSNTHPSGSLYYEQSSKFTRSHEDLRRLSVQSQCLAIEAASQTETIFRSTTILGAQDTPSNHEHSEKEMDKDFKSLCDAEPKSSEEIKELKTNSGRVKTITIQEVHDVHENKELRDGKNIQEMTSPVISQTTCQENLPLDSNDDPQGNLTNASILTQKPSHLTSVVSTKSALASLSSGPSSKTRKSVSFSLIQYSSSLPSASMLPLEWEDTYKNVERNNDKIRGAEPSNVISPVNDPIKGILEPQEFSDDNVIELCAGNHLSSHTNTIVSPQEATDRSTAKTPTEKSVCIEGAQRMASANIAVLPHIENSEAINEISPLQIKEVAKQVPLTESSLNTKANDEAGKGAPAAQCSVPDTKFAAAILVKTSPISRRLSSEPKKSIHEKEKSAGKSPKALYRKLKQQRKPFNLSDEGYKLTSSFFGTKKELKYTDIIIDEESNTVKTTEMEIKQEENSKFTQASIQLPPKKDETTSTQASDNGIPLRRIKSAPGKLDCSTLFQPQTQAHLDQERYKYQPCVASAANQSGKLTIKNHKKIVPRQMKPHQQNANVKHQSLKLGVRNTIFEKKTAPSPDTGQKCMQKTGVSHNFSVKVDGINSKSRLKVRKKRKMQMAQRLPSSRYKIDIALQRAVERAKRFRTSTIKIACTTVTRTTVIHREVERKFQAGFERTASKRRSNTALNQRKAALPDYVKVWNQQAQRRWGNTVTTP